MEISGSEMHFQPIRYLNGISTVLNLCLSYAIAIYHMVLRKYRPYELDSFAKKYLTEWRERFRSIPSVKYRDVKNGSAS
jgi:hypothetical protein